MAVKKQDCTGPKNENHRQKTLNIQSFGSLIFYYGQKVQTNFVRCQWTSVTGHWNITAVDDDSRMCYVIRLSSIYSSRLKAECCSIR